MNNEAYKKLLDEVQQLMAAGSPRRALEKVLVALDRSPDDANTLRLAQIVAHQSRTAQIKVIEPIPPEYLNDTRLDPIVAVCAVCGATWIPRPDLGYAKIGALNPIGAHCPSCNVVLCRNCFARRRRAESPEFEGFGEDAGERLDPQDLGEDVVCPICGGELTLAVKPTGRRARQLKRQEGRVLDFVVLREGFIRPDPEYLTNLVRYLSPDVLETKGVGIHAHTVPPGGAKDMVGLMHAILTRLRLENYPDRRLETEVAQASDRDGQIVVIGKLFSPVDAPPSESSPKPAGDHWASRILHRTRRWFRRRFSSPVTQPRPMEPHTSPLRPRRWTGGVLFWFNWTQISAGVSRRYGAYVYRNLLPLCAEEASPIDPPGLYFFYDGDVLARGENLSIPLRGPTEKLCLDRVKEIGTDKCYVVAILASGCIDWAQVDRELRRRAIVGYLGQTTWPRASYEDFEDLMEQMALPCALELRGRTIRKVSFEILREDELHNIGFTTSSDPE